MRKNKYIALFIGIVAMLCSCSDVYDIVPEPGNSITGLTIIQPDGTKTVYAAKANEKNEINLVIDGSIKTDMSKLRLFVNVPNNAIVKAESPLGEYMDFTKPVKVDVVGIDGEVKSYSISATLFASKIDITERWKKNGMDELGFTKFNNRSLAISGNYLVIHDSSAKGANKYYDITTGEYKGTLNNEGIDFTALHLVSDEAGNMVTSSFGASGSMIDVFWWNGVEGKPKKLVGWESTVAKILGRKLYVKGDMNKLAYLYMTEQQGNHFVRWEIKNGVVTSNEPDIVEFYHPDADLGWGVNGRVIPIELGKESNYFINTDRKVGITYMNGKTNSSIYHSEYEIKGVFEQWLKGSQVHAVDYLDLNGARYLFRIEQDGGNWFPSVFRVHGMMKDPSAVQGINSLVYQRKYNSWSTDYSFTPNLGQNTNVTGEVECQISPDGKSATVAFICTNQGVVVWDIELS